MTRSLTKKRERQKQWQVQPACERIAKSNDSLDERASGRLIKETEHFFHAIVKALDRASFQTEVSASKPRPVA